MLKCCNAIECDKNVFYPTATCEGEKSHFPMGYEMLKLYHSTTCLALFYVLYIYIH